MRARPVPALVVAASRAARQDHRHPRPARAVPAARRVVQAFKVGPTSSTPGFKPSPRAPRLHELSAAPSSGRAWEGPPSAGAHELRPCPLRVEPRPRPPLRRGLRTGMLIALAAALALAWSALCPHATEARGVVDQTGRTVDVELPARRIVSLVPSVTEIVFAIGAAGPARRRHRLLRLPGGGAGEAERRRHAGPEPGDPRRAQARPRGRHQRGQPRGDVHADRADAHPRLPGRSHHGGGRSSTWSRASGGSPGTRPRRPGSRRRSTRACAALTARLADLPRPRVLYVLWPDPLIVPGRGAIVSELLSLAGGASVTADVQGAVPALRPRGGHRAHAGDHPARQPQPGTGAAGPREVGALQRPARGRRRAGSTPWTAA